MSRNRDRALRNEQTFRKANEEIDDRRRQLELGGRTPYICECENEHCTELVHLSLDEYRGVRAGGDMRFVLLPGHQSASEHVVETTDGFVIVEKGPAGQEQG